MSRLSVALLLVASLVLTVYFGAAAWRLTDDRHMDITGHIQPRSKVAPRAADGVTLPRNSLRISSLKRICYLSPLGD
jgi:hypothetical protein